MRTITFKASYWSFEEIDDEMVINVRGNTSDNQSVFCKVLKFEPYLYMQLPASESWNKEKCDRVFNYLKFNLCKDSPPTRYEPYSKRLLHYNEPMNAIKLFFKNQRACSRLANIINGKPGKMMITGWKVFKNEEFKVHETVIDPILKFTAVQNLKLCGWMVATEYIYPGEERLTIDERKFSSCDIDMCTLHTSLVNYEQPSIVVVRSKYISFDIETRSVNHNSKIPDATQQGNNIFSVGIVSGWFGETDFNKILVTLGDPHDQSGITTLRCKDEKTLLLTFRDVMLQEDPQYILGYNIMKFDWDYMITRAEKLGIIDQFLKMTCVDGKDAKIETKTWESSAYGKQEFRYLDIFGRVNIDIFIEVERNFKWPKYSLEYASTELLGEHKDDISHRQLFILVDLFDELYPRINALPSENIVSQELKSIRDRVTKIMTERFCSGEVTKLRKNLLKSKTKSELLRYVRDTLTITGKYNIQDCQLVINLAEKLNILVSMEETSNTVFVPLSYLHTRGQGIKVLSQIYRQSIVKNYVIPWQRKITDEEKKRYVGAIVAKATPGYYENVACFDFASLYPSSMIAYNICFTTLLRDDDPTPDELCNVLVWEDHQGCEHDVTERTAKVAKDKILCQKHHYRFKKLKLLPNGERVDEGIMPKMERELLSSRKIVKKEMEKLEAIVDMVTGKATPENIAEYKELGWEIYTVNQLDEKQLRLIKEGIKILNARQLAIKVAANSGYGILGSQQGPVPLIQGAASVTYIGRTLITAANSFLTSRFLGDAENDYKGRVMLVYGDTDSTMVYFKGCNATETYDLAEKIAPSISHHLKTHIMKVPEDYTVTIEKSGETFPLQRFPRKRIAELSDEYKVKVYEYDALPISLTFENLYGKYFLLTKKRYCAQIVNRLGEFKKDTKKGVVLARRDNSQYLRDTYKQLISGVMKKLEKAEMLDIVNDRVNKLFTRQIPDEHLIIYIGVKNVISYAKKKEIKRNGTNVTCYLNPVTGETFETTDPLDSRLVYSNIPQAVLSLKLLRRGEEIPPNTRLEFLYLQAPNGVKVEHQGEKAEDFTYFKDNKASGLIPDYLFYVEKQLGNPLTELLNVKFRGDVVPYLPVEEAVERGIKKLNELQSTRVARCKVFSFCIENGEVVSASPFTASGVAACSYTFKGIDAKVNYIIHDYKYHTLRGEKNHISDKKLFESCLLYKSKTIIKNREKQFKCPKRTWKKPPQTSENLRITTRKNGALKIVFVEDYLTLKEGDFGIIRDKRDRVNEMTLKKVKCWFYDIEVDGVLYKDVPRSVITTFTRKDNLLLKNIFNCREAYLRVVAELKKLFYKFVLV